MITDLLDRVDPGFFEPIWLVVGFFAMIAVALLEIGAYRRRKQAIQLFAALHLAASLTGSVSLIRRVIKAVLLVLSVGLIFVALARPHLFYDWAEEKRTGLDVLLAVDCSKSMLTEDVKPSRLERAKLAISDFADRLPDNRLGLIAFSGDAFLQCPLTLDHDAFQNAVRSLDMNSIPRPGTNIASAIDLAVDALRSQPSNMKFLVLVTDGEDLEGRALNAARNAAQNGLKIFTVGVGTAAGEMIPEPNAGGMAYHRDNNNNEVTSRLDESTLRQIAEITGGAYLALGQRGEGLQDIYNAYIAPLPKQNLEEKREKIRIERFEWPLALAILLLMLEYLIRERASTPEAEPVTSTTRRRIPRKRKAAVAVSLTAWLVFIGLDVTRGADTDGAEKAYKSGQYEDALQKYQKAVEKQPTRKELKYNSGDAAYRAGDYSEAEEQFRDALETPDLGLQEKSYFNLGNAQFEHGRAMQKVDSKKTIGLWEQALHSYDSALKLNESADTQANYDYVKKLLEQLKKQQEQKDQQKKGKGKSDGKDPSGKGSQGDQGGSGQQGDQGDPSNPENGNEPKPEGDKDGKDKGQDGQQQPGQGEKKAPVKTYSDKRSQDSQDPGVKSKQDAENLLDSLKDDERHISARAMSGNEQPPPPPSGKDW